MVIAGSIKEITRDKSKIDTPGKSAIMRISFEETAIRLEKLCSEVDKLEEISEEIKNVFTEANIELAESVDKRISYIKYAESQIDAAKNMRDSWGDRVRRFECIVKTIKQNTLEFIRFYPNLPYRGQLGSFKVRRNSRPALRIDDGVNFTDSEYLIWHSDIDLDRLRRDLQDGKIVEGAILEYGEHLRIEAR